MQFPLSSGDISLWLAIISIILLATSELLSPYYGQTNIIIDRKKLRAVALVLGVLFVLTVLMQIYDIGTFT